MTLPDDVVELAARAICQRELANYDCERACMAVHKCVGKLSECVIADARAALEAARYGEMRQLLADSRSYLEAFRLKEAGKALMGEIGRMPIRQLCKHVDALLSTIGEPTDIGASQS